MRRIWVSGSRSYELNVFQDNDPKVQVIKEVLRQNLTEMLNQSTEEFWLLTGPQLGIERWSIETGLALKKDYSQLKIAIMAPFADFGNHWKEDNQVALSQIKTAVDFAGDVSQSPYQSPRQLQNYAHFMLTHSEGSILVYDPDFKGKPRWDYRAIRRWQENHQYALRLIDFDELQNAAEEWGERQREKQDNSDQ